MGIRTGVGRTGRTGLALFGLWLALLATPVLAAECRDDTVWLRGDWGQARFTVDVADEDAERTRGLMFVEDMPRSKGMLFVFPQERPRAFWMRNTLISLDIIFVDAAGVVVNIAADAIPGDETALPSTGPAQYVLEINGGLAAAMGIAAGTQLRHPAIDPAQSAWPCAAG